MRITKLLASVLYVCLLVCTAMFPIYGYAVTDGADVSYAAASEAMVLLKNENNALPLTSSDKIAIFGNGQVYTNGKNGGYLLMGLGSGYFVPSETPKSPCDVLVSYVDAGKLGGVYTSLSESYKAAAAAESADANFVYLPTAAEYAAAAEYADKAVYILNRPTSEGSDRGNDYFELTNAERVVLQKVCEAFDGKPVIVVLNSGYVINCGFANGREEGIYADALITAPYLGIRGTEVLCDTLVGDISPSGKLVDTYAKTLTDYPSYEGFNESADYSTYYEDIYVGYRYFETFNKDADYPFGYGLSYTAFDISDVTYSENNGEITVTAKVTNTGDVSGKEVVQVYYGAPQKGSGTARLSKAARVLCGFAKTSLLAPGKSETLSISFAVDTMASYDDLGVTGHTSAYVMEAGDYSVYVGNSVRNTIVAGTHTEKTLRVTEQLSELCEPTTAFERMTFDGTETVGEESSFRSDLLHIPTEAVQSTPSELIKFKAVLDGEATAKEFLAQMSNEELATFALMTNAAPNTGAWGASVDVVEKYGMPLAYTCDGPAGIRTSTKGTGLPCATALACTWNPEAVSALGDVIGRECVATDIDVWLAPGVNIHRYPLCGRNFEYYSEDPYISGVMASELIKGVEKHGVATSIKHFIANEKERNRMQVDSRMSERALREIYLVPFKMGVEAGVSTVMTSYNFLNGSETSESAELLRGILRGEWGFDGLITTDWTNDSNLAKEIIAGNNVHSSMHYGADGSAYEYHMDNKYAEIIEGINDGSVSRSLLIENAEYMMELLDDTYSVENIYVKHDVSASGATVIEAENYTFKHGYARPEVSSARTVMAYVRATDKHVPYLIYELDAEKAGTYILSTSMANAATDPVSDALRVFVNGEEQFTNYNADVTGGWSKVATAEIGAIYLPKGASTLKIMSAENRACGNFDSFTLTPIEETYTLIGSAEELIALMGNSADWGKNYYLAADIDLTGVAGQGPIGTKATNFTGIFDGMGHYIKGVALSSSTEQDYGLFGKIKGATVRNLTVYGDVESTKDGSAVVGGIVGTLDPDSFVINCKNYVNVTYSSTTNAAKGVGGVVGYIYAGSTNTGTVVKNCENYGTVKSMSGGKDAIVGGIAGIISTNAASGTASPGNALVVYCENHGDVIAEGIKAGGIVGYIDQLAPGGKAEVAYCINHGSVTSTKGRMGGVVGWVYGRTTTESRIPSISFCINKGAVTTDVGYESAGVLGYNTGVNVDNCVNLGTLTANDSATSTKPMGGVVGKTYLVTTLVFNITNCYTVSGDVIPSVGYEKPEQFRFASCGTVTESDIINKNTTLTYGDDGYAVVENELILAAFAPSLEKDEEDGIGDINGDGKVSLLDVCSMIKYVLGKEENVGLDVADMNKDGALSLIDVLILIKKITA